MNINMFLAIAIFLIAYALIMTEKIHRTVVGLAGASLLIACGIVSQEAAISHIDFNTLGLLIGMMIIVNITGETGLFHYLAVWAAKKVKADPVALLVVLSVLTAVCSAFLDNVTTVLLTVPITFTITRQLKVGVMPYLISQILAANIGGAATLIGDPPNIMIGSAAGIPFLAFITNLAGICTAVFVVTELLIMAVYRKNLHTTEERKAAVMALDEKSSITNRRLLTKCLFVLALTITLFVFHDVLHLQTATAALSGASILLILTCHNNEIKLAQVMSHVEWLAIFFFAGLFVLVGGLVETGVIKALATWAMALTAGDVTVATMLILWMSAFASAFVDNIPFVATMIPLIRDMGTMGMTNLDTLWWALSLGACLGGNGTLIGASANVVVAALAAKNGEPISFLYFLKVGFPFMVLSIIMSSLFLYVCYL